VHSPRHVKLRISNLFGDDLHRGDQDAPDPSAGATAATPNPEQSADDSGMAISGDADSAADLRVWISERLGGLDQKISKLEQNLEDRYAKLETPSARDGARALIIWAAKDCIHLRSY
jgi:hypothetical protein